VLRAITVDDEFSNQILLKRFVEKESLVEVVAQFTEPLSLLEQVEAIQPDVAFVDIEMPVMNGLELAEKLLPLCPDTHIVFVTAYSQYAIEAFRVNALDYLLKPIDAEEMKRVLHKLMSSMDPKPHVQPLDIPILIPQCRIQTLGDFEVHGTHSKPPVQWLTAKVEELLAYLVMHADKSVGKETLCEVLWPDSDYEKGLMNLYTTVYRLRKTLLRECVSLQIICGKDGYQVQTEGCVLDFKDFERLTYDIEDKNKTDGGYWETEKILEAEKLYQGELFANRLYLWSAPYRETFNQKYRTVCYRLAESFLENEDHEQAARYLKKIIAGFPDEEQACMLLMDIFKFQNNKAAVAEYSEAHIRYLQEELNVMPSVEFQNYCDSLEREG